jgi:hypothetical protein
MALEDPPQVAAKQVQCSEQGDLAQADKIQITDNAKPAGPYGKDVWHKVTDIRQSTLGVGVMTTASINATLNYFGFAGGVMLLDTRNLQSERFVLGARKAQKIKRLKIPKNVSDLDNWNDGDNITYELAISGIAMFGVGAFGVGVGTMPSVEGAWQIVIVKKPDNHVELKAATRKEIRINGIIHEIIIQHRSGVSTNVVKDHTFLVDLKTDNGQRIFKRFMKYKHLFPGGMKPLKKAAAEAQDGVLDVIETEKSKKNTKAAEIRKINIRVPLIARKAIGSRYSREEQLIEDPRLPDGENQTIRKVSQDSKYNNSKVPKKIWKKKNRDGVVITHRARNTTHTYQGIETQKGDDIQYSGNAVYSYRNDSSHSHQTKKALKQLAKFSGTEPIKLTGPNGKKLKGSLNIEARATLTDAGIRMLIANNAEKLAAIRDLSLENDDAYQLSKLLYRIREIGDLINSDKDPSSEIKSLMHKIPRKPVIINAIKQIVGNELQIVQTIEGTSFLPMQTALI